MKKAQANLQGFFILLIVGGILAIVGVLIFSKVDSITGAMIDHDEEWTRNESVTITASTELGDNSTVLSVDGYVANSEVVYNRSTGQVLERNVEYTITQQGGSEGDLTTIGNFTLTNVTAYNGTALGVDYRTYELSAFEETSDTLGSTVLDSFELGVTAFIVLAAAVILGAVFLFSRRS